jgi:hypothetical protein
VFGVKKPIFIGIRQLLDIPTGTTWVSVSNQECNGTMAKVLNRNEIADNEWHLAIKNGEKVILRSDDYSVDIYAIKNGSEKSIGRFEFQEEEPSSFEPSFGSYKLMYMGIKDRNYKRMGIGREVLNLFRRFNGGTIYASKNDGIKRSDGSHLVKDGPDFVSRMQNEGLIEKSVNEVEDENFEKKGDMINLSNGWGSVAIKHPLRLL